MTKQSLREFPAPGDVIIDAVSRLLVVDPVANENAGGCLGQPTGAQHAVAVALSIAEAAFVHLSVGVPADTRTGMKQGLRVRLCPVLLSSVSGFCRSYLLELAESMDLAISPLALVAVGLVQLFVGH